MPAHAAYGVFLARLDTAGANRARPDDGGARSGVSACIALELVLEPGPDPALHAATEGPDSGPGIRSQPLGGPASLRS